MSFSTLTSPWSKARFTRESLVTNVSLEFLTVACVWLLFCSFCVNRTWREHSRHWTRTHKNCKDSFSSGSILTTSQQDGDNKDSLNDIPFSSKRKWMKSHTVHWLFGLEPNGHKKDENAKSSDHDSLTCFSQHAEQSSRNGEKMYSVRHRRCFRRHGCPCEALWIWSHCHEKCDCHTVA